MNRPVDLLAIAIAQLNPTVGDVVGNAAKARRARAQAAADKADIVAFPELFIAGYSPEDLVLKPAFQAACRVAVEELARETADGGPAVLIGLPWAEEGKLYNAYCLLEGGRIAAVRWKVDLPNYGVFDEKRVFAAGPMPGPINFRGVRIGIPICEDIWAEEVVECLVETGAELLIVPNGSPYWARKDELRLNIVVARVTESGLPLLYVNQVGGQDELVFDGSSFALHAGWFRPAGLSRGGGHHPLATAERRSKWYLALRRRSGGAGGARRQRGLHRLRARPARLCEQERIQGRRARPVGRRRFRAVRRDRGRRARA
jgi:NAD+ synthase